MATIVGSKDIVKILMDNACDIHLTDQFNRTCLHMATIFNNFNIVSYLVEQGAKIDKQMKVMV